MNLRSVLLPCAVALLLSALPARAPVEAATGIQRCQSPDGSLVYTDRNCATFRARPVPMPAALLARIAQEQAVAARTGGRGVSVGSMEASLPLAGDATAYAHGRRSPAAGCARTPTQLQMDLRAALALGDVNRVAESYHWVGMSSRQGERTLDRLQHLTGKPVLDSHYFNAQIADADGGTLDGGSWLATSGSPARGGDAGIMQLLLGNAAAPSVTEFDVHRYAGCYFVSF